MWTVIRWLLVYVLYMYSICEYKIDWLLAFYAFFLIFYCFIIFISFSVRATLVRASTDGSCSGSAVRMTLRMVTVGVHMTKLVGHKPNDTISGMGRSWCLLFKIAMLKDI